MLRGRGLTLSRGLGRIEREILAIIENNNTLFSSIELVVTVYAAELREGNGKFQSRLRANVAMVSVRRALRSLVDKKKIVRIADPLGGGERYDDSWRRYANPDCAARYFKVWDEIKAWRLLGTLRLDLLEQLRGLGGELSVRQCAKLMGCSPRTIRRDVKGA